MSQPDTSQAETTTGQRAVHKPAVMQLISSLEVGGAEKLMIALLDEAKQHKDARFVAVVMNDAVNPDLKAALEATGWPVYFLERPASHKHPRYLVDLLRIVVEHEVRVIHAHNYGSKVWALACKMILPTVQVAFTVHDTGIIPPMGLLHKLVQRHLVDANIAISKAVEAECLAHGVSRTRQIYNAIDIARFERPTPWQPPREGRLRIVNVARMDYHKKGQDVLLYALKQCRERGLDFDCKLIGGVYDYNRQSFAELQLLTGELQLSDRVEFITDCTDVVPHLHGADLFVLPSRYEGLGLVVLEAMAAGVPVITSNIDGPAELIEDGKTGVLFEPDNPDELADQIMRLDNNHTRLRFLSEQAHDGVQRFDIPVMTRQYLELYQLMLSGLLQIKLPHHPNRNPIQALGT